MKGFRTICTAIQPPTTSWPVGNTGGLRAGAQELWAKWEGHRDGLSPRIEALFKRHEAGERIQTEDLAVIERDLLTLRVETSALSDYLSMFLLYEELVRDRAARGPAAMP